MKSDLAQRGLYVSSVPWGCSLQVEVDLQRGCAHITTCRVSSTPRVNNFGATLLHNPFTFMVSERLPPTILSRRKDLVTVSCVLFTRVQMDTTDGESS